MSLSRFVAALASVLIALVQPALAQQKRMLDCTIESTSLSECDVQAYLIRVAVFAGPGIVVGVLMIFLCCPCYCMGKYCCNCCGGRHQTPNFCCVDDKYPARYSRGDIMRPRVIGVMAMLIAAGAVGWGATGSVTLIGGLLDLKNAITGVPNLLQTQIDAIDTALNVTRYRASDDTTYVQPLFGDLAASASSLKNDLKGSIDSFAAQYQSYVDLFTKIVIGVFSAPIVIMVVGNFLSCCNVRSCLPMTLLWFLFLTGGLLWLSHGIFSGVSMAIGDACAEIHGLVRQQTNVIAVLFNCQDSMFDSFRNSFNRIQQQQATAACNKMLTMCYDTTQSTAANMAATRVFECPPAGSFDCNTISFGALLTLLRSWWYIHSSVSTFPGAVNAGTTCYSASRCTLEACSQECRQGGTPSGSLSTLGRQVKEAWFDMRAAAQVSTAIDTVGAQYSNCDSIMSLLVSPFDAPCTSIVNGVVFARQATGLEGLCAIAFVFVLGWGAKRFISLEEADVPQSDKPEEVDDAAH